MVTRPDPRGRRRRLLAACRWRSDRIDVREHVRAVEQMIGRRR